MREYIVWTITCALIATLSWWVLWERVAVMMLGEVIEIIINQTYALCEHSHFINYFFYHLPTRGRVGIKLEDVDTSPTYL